MTLYKYDTHVHTAETSYCAMIIGTKVAKLYKDAGYAGIVITDHYLDDFFESLRGMTWDQKIDKFLAGYENALETGYKVGLDVLLGMEIRFTENYNDYLIYGFDEYFLRTEKQLYKLGLKKFRELTKGTGIMIYQAHPFRSWVSPADPEYLDGVEVFNGSPRYNSRNHRALNFAKENNLKMLSGSDFHEDDDLGQGGIILSGNPKTSGDFAAILSEDKIMELLQGEDE